MSFKNLLKKLRRQSALKKGQIEVMLQQRWIYSLKSVSDLDWKNVAGPKTENSF